jgi:hypothetical protein
VIHGCTNAMRTMVAALTAAAGLVAVPGAGGKDFEPGDLSVCNAARCVPVMRAGAVERLGRFYYLGAPPARMLPPALGTPYYELRFSNDYVTGIVATRRLDRFLSYGVYLERFRRGNWYRVPPKIAAELRAVAVGLRPLRLTRAAVARSR